MNRTTVPVTYLQTTFYNMNYTKYASILSNVW